MEAVFATIGIAVIVARFIRNKKGLEKDNAWKEEMLRLKIKHDRKDR
jgi:hypothetical protein